MHIGFYQLTRGALEQALFKLLQKVWESGKRAVVVTDTEERVEYLTTLLWTMHQGSFLPHGSAKDGNAPLQPIWLSTQVERPNGASIVLLLHNTFTQELTEFDRALVIFDHTDPEQTASARHAWQHYSAQGHDMVLWGQNEQGEWQKKNFL